jgi:hypothetical protein
MADRRRNLGIPSGVIFPFAGTTAPYGYLIGDGRPVAIAEYPTLFAAIGYAHGDGSTNSDGTPSGFTSATHFNLPDPRGRFMRGVDGLAGVDPDKASRTASRTGANTGNTVGSVQADANASHTHIQNSHDHNTFSDGNFWKNDGAAGGGVNAWTDQPSGGGTRTGAATATNQNSGGNESRPKNLNVNYIVKV